MSQLSRSQPRRAIQPRRSQPSRSTRRPVAAIVFTCMALVTGAGLGGVGAPGRAAAQPPAPSTVLPQSESGSNKPLNIVADSVTVDIARGGFLARGHVRVTYGEDLATADLLHLTKASRTVELSGHAKITDPQGKAAGDTILLYVTADNRITRAVMRGHASVEGKEYALSADQIDADRASGRMLARGHVNAFSAPDLIVTGDRITYDQRTQYAVVSGHPVVSNRVGRLEGDRMELFRAEDRAVIHGPVSADVYGATITGAGATVNFKTSVAVFTGKVVVTRRQGTLWADRVSVYYDAQRIHADGTARAHFNDLGEEETSP